MGPPAKTASKPYLKCLDAGLPTLSFLHNFYLVYPCSLYVNQQHSIPELHVLTLLQPYETAIPTPKLHPNCKRMWYRWHSAWEILGFQYSSHKHLLAVWCVWGMERWCAKNSIEKTGFLQMDGKEKIDFVRLDSLKLLGFKGEMVFSWSKWAEEGWKGAVS